MGVQQWFYYEGKRKEGPVSEEHLKELLAKGVISPDVYVWTEGFRDWKHAYEVPLLAGSSQPRYAKTGNSVAHLDLDAIARFEREKYRSPNIKKTPVLLTILYTGITLGIYMPIWFLTRRKAINGLHSPKKLRKDVLIYCLVGYCVSILLTLCSVLFSILIPEQFDHYNLWPPSPICDAVSNVIDLAVGITLIVMAFRARSVFQRHFNSYLQRNIKFSGIMTLFFTIYYLQYKVNRF